MADWSIQVLNNIFPSIEQCGYLLEYLLRIGIGHITVIDGDCFEESNLNRQIAALHSTLGQPKAEVMARRVQDINPDCQVKAVQLFYLPQTASQVDLSQYDYVVDCIDTVTAKLELVTRCNALQINIISAMGTGNKFDPSALVVTDISKTQGCPLARVMRKELRRRGVPALKVVFSPEEPRPTGVRTPGSVSFVPGAAGLVLAGAVVRALAEGPGKKDC